MCYDVLLKMKTIQTENLWFNKIRLSDAEEVMLSYPANRTQERRAVGGKLFVTNYRIAFAPNRIDAKLGGATWEISLSGFSSADTIKPRISLMEIFSGALVTRLAVYCTNTDTQFFVVSSPKNVASQFNNLINNLAEQDSAHQPTTR